MPIFILPDNKVIITILKCHSTPPLWYSVAKAILFRDIPFCSPLWSGCHVGCQSHMVSSGHQFTWVTCRNPSYHRPISINWKTPMDCQIVLKWVWINPKNLLLMYKLSIAFTDGNQPCTYDNEAAVDAGLTQKNKNIERHTAHTIVSRPNLK